MIQEWELVSDPNDNFPNRHRANLNASAEDVKPILDHFGERAGKPWSPRVGKFKLSFYMYEMNDQDRQALESFFKTGTIPAIPPPAPAPPPPAAPPPPDLRAREPVRAEAPAPKSVSKAAPPPSRKAVDDFLLFTPGQAGADGPSAGPGAGAATASPPRIAPKQDELDRVLPSDQPEPAVPKGKTLVRLGYLVPQDMGYVVNETHALLVQTLESRNMPFVFHNAFSFLYSWLDKPVLDQIAAGYEKYGANGLICVGDEKRMQSFLDDLAEKKVIFHFLSRQDMNKRFWRLGLITRIVLKE